MSALVCRLRGHRWGEWYDCLRPGLRASECGRCGVRRFIDYYAPDDGPSAYNFGDTERSKGQSALTSVLEVPFDVSEWGDRPRLVEPQQLSAKEKAAAEAELRAKFRPRRTGPR